MAEFLTMEDAENKFGTKGRTNAGLTAGTAASNWNAVNTAINGACPSCQAQ